MSRNAAPKETFGSVHDIQKTAAKETIEQEHDSKPT